MDAGLSRSPDHAVRSPTEMADAWGLAGRPERLAGWLRLHAGGWWRPARGWEGVRQFGSLAEAVSALAPGPGPGGAKGAREDREALGEAGWGRPGISVESFFDGSYPARLRDLAHLAPPLAPPLLLFRRGTVPPGPAVAVVGARRADTYGLRVARRIARGLAARGVTVVSGLARGVDRAAHEGALEGGGKTVAVLGSGILRPYPAEHAALADAIAESGAVLSEFPARFAPRPHAFPLRNRVIAALADVVVVVEAGERSGALGTAAHGEALQRVVAAVPGDVDRALSAGTNLLLRDGAQPVAGPDDVAALLPEGVRSRAPHESRAAAGQDAPSGEALRRVWEALKLRPRNVDELVVETGLPVPRLLAALTELELQGRAVREGDGFARGAGPSY